MKENLRISPKYLGNAYVINWIRTVLFFLAFGSVSMGCPLSSIRFVSLCDKTMRAGGDEDSYEKSGKKNSVCGKVVVWES